MNPGFDESKIRELVVAEHIIWNILLVYHLTHIKTINPPTYISGQV